MVRHILFWKLKDEFCASDQRAQAMRKLADSVATLRGIDGLLRAEIGWNEAGGEYNVVFYSEFADQAALEAFRDHPLHVAHRERCAPLVTGRLAGDLLTDVR